MSRATDRDLFRGLKWQFQVLAAVLFGAATVSFALGEVVANNDRHAVAFAIPALEAHDHWHAEVSAFSGQVKEAFGVREQVADRFSGWILEAAQRQDFDPYLIAGLIATESSFRINVRSHVGAIGPAQVRPNYWARFCGTSDLHDPEQNIYCGAQVLAHYRERCGGEVCALKAYNVGLHGKRPSAAQRYVTKVDRHRAAISSLAAL